MTLKLGVDVGGTFTDVLLLAQDTGELTIAKVLSTPEDQSAGVIAGVQQACRTRGVSPAELSLILLGSTVVTNMIPEEKGAQSGLLTTAGHEQILHLARAWTPGPLYPWMGMVKPDPLVPLWRTYGVAERMGADGEVVEALDEDGVRPAVQALIDDGIELLTIAFLNAYVNPAHERREREIALELRPTLPVSISSDLVSEYREYERALTAVLNSYVQPQVLKYVDHLESELHEQGFTGRFNIVPSDGGTMSAKATKERPLDIAFSGPSGGVVGAAYLARQAGVPNVLTLDMGGTSTDVSLCLGGAVTIKREAQLGYYQFQARGADIHSVGAGGGSIAYLNLAGALRVGPVSAGADPGPACYGKGGEAPTVTDANVVLGRIPAASRLGGSLELDVDAAHRAVEKVGQGLGDRHRRGRAGDHRHRQREHARSSARGERGTRLRPAGLRVRGLRRSGTGARERAGQADRILAADHPLGARRAQRIRLHRRRRAERVRPDIPAHDRRHDHGQRARGSRHARRRGPRVAVGGGGRPDRPGVRAVRRLSLLPPGHPDSVLARSRGAEQRLRGGAAGRLRGRASPALRVRPGRADRDRHPARGRARRDARSAAGARPR